MSWASPARNVTWVRFRAARKVTTHGPIAIVNGRPVGDPNRKHSNHAFYGPGYPIAHPGIFPFNPRSLRWAITEWLRFDWRSGWGTPVLGG